MDILWSIFIITILVITIVIVVMLIPTLLQLKRTLKALEELSTTFNNEFKPAFKDLADLTTRANNSIKTLEKGLELKHKLDKNINLLGKFLNKSINILTREIYKDYISIKAGIKEGLKVLAAKKGD